MATNGLVVMTPTSIAYSGTSASINADGSVNFSAVTSLSLNGVFSADYDNYMITMRYVGTANQRNFLARLRSSGADASGADYTRQLLLANGTSVVGVRTGSVSYFYYTHGDSEQRSGSTGYIFGPYLTQPTALRTVAGSGDANATIWDEANTHSLSTSYDGISFITDQAGTTYTGLLTVFGFNQ